MTFNNSIIQKGKTAHTGTKQLIKKMGRRKKTDRQNTMRYNRQTVCKKERTKKEEEKEITRKKGKKKNEKFTLISYCCGMGGIENREWECTMS